MAFIHIVVNRKNVNGIYAYCCNKMRIFLYFGPFLKKITEINPTETYFQHLAPLSHVSSVGVTHEGVVPFALARVMGQARGLVPMWHHVGCSRAKRTGVTQSR
jgi:hypothetical protein